MTMASNGVDFAVESPSQGERSSSAPTAPIHPAATVSSSTSLFRAILSSLLIPIAALIALAAHFLIPNSEPTPPTSAYPILLLIILALSSFIALVQVFSPALRCWFQPRVRLLSAAMLVVCAWQLITLKFALLPLPYFPSPELVLQSLISDRALLFESTWRSLILLAGGYACGVLAGLVSGICIGWSTRVRYWGMPILKIVGPIPATAWIPLAMVLSPSALISAIALIALAVWFPVTMLTASGISNVRVAYLDVAKTLGANRNYLIFRVAIPAALPSIFIGLFMGLGTSFLTLIVAEMMGVKAGLGWYITWARDWAEYSKVFAALIIMAAFFSTIMTLLFFIRDRVLVWQKGVIKW
jgi:NitT/TauT family transport system permease protein